jgi:hypothetical protein
MLHRRFGSLCQAAKVRPQRRVNKALYLPEQLSSLVAPLAQDAANRAQNYLPRTHQGWCDGRDQSGQALREKDSRIQDQGYFSATMELLGVLGQEN